MITTLERIETEMSKSIEHSTIYVIAKRDKIHICNCYDVVSMLETKIIKAVKDILNKRNILEKIFDKLGKVSIFDVEVSEEYDYYDYDYECEIININKVKI
jgi:ribosome-interacting GTPase 1